VLFLRNYPGTPPSALRDAHFRATTEQSKTIPGISELGACTILAEIGRDISRFQSAWTASRTNSTEPTRNAPQNASSSSWAASATPLISRQSLHKR
jgi:hypothetical protein